MGARWTLSEYCTFARLTGTAQVPARYSWAGAAWTRRPEVTTQTTASAQRNRSCSWERHCSPAAIPSRRSCARNTSWRSASNHRYTSRAEQCTGIADEDVGHRPSPDRVTTGSHPRCGVWSRIRRESADVKGQFDFPLGGQLISLLADSSCPCPRSADLLLI